MNTIENLNNYVTNVSSTLANFKGEEAARKKGLVEDFKNGNALQQSLAEVQAQTYTAGMSLGGSRNKTIDSERNR